MWGILQSAYLDLIPDTTYSLLTPHPPQEPRNDPWAHTGRCVTPKNHELKSFKVADDICSQGQIMSFQEKKYTKIYIQKYITLENMHLLGVWKLPNIWRFFLGRLRYEILLLC